MNNGLGNSVFGPSSIPDDKFILVRPRINALLEKALDNLVVFINAGEGYGKTSAVHSFLRQGNKKAIWIPMSERDNAPGHFWETVIKAVAFHDPGAGKILEEIGFPESPGQITRCLSVMTEGADANREKYVVVVDDCHLVHEELILKFVNRLLVFPLPRETIIMISRAEPRLNTMSLLSKGLMFRIRADDLRFNEEEITAYFRLRNMGLSPEESKQIYTDTEGWVLAISLIAEEMESGGRKYNRSLLENGGFRAMEERLFASVPVSLRRFLIMLSLFDQWPLEAIEKVVASLPEKLPSMDKLAENMDHLSSLIRYDAYLHGFRIHRVFLDYLREKQKELSREEIRTVCTLAAQWCMGNRFWMEAAINYGIAGNYQGLLQAIYSFPRLISQSAAASFLEIIDRVLKDNNRDEEDSHFLFLRHVTRAGILINLGRYAESRAVLDESIRKFEALPQSKLSSWILSSCYNTLGALSIATYRTSRDLSHALEYFERCNFYYSYNPFTIPGPMNKVNVGSYVNFIGNPPKPGEFEEYIGILSQCIPYASASIGGFLSGMDSLCWAEFAFFRGDLNVAEQHAREAVFKAREKKQYETESKALFYLLRIQLFNGDSASRKTWEQMEAQLDIPDYINRNVIHNIMAGWFYAHIGDIEQIAYWLRNDIEESNLNLLFHNFESMVKAKSLFAEKQYRETLQFLERNEVEEGLGSFHLGMLEITVLKMAARCRMDDQTAALKTLEAAYELSTLNFRNGASASCASFDMPFIELGEDMRALADAALAGETVGPCAIPRPWLEMIRNKASIYEKKLTTVKERYLSHLGVGNIPFLSTQELSILAGISKGYTREDIAKNCSLSVNTVKNIIKTIYEKLGAFNRADAIRIATQAGLLKP